MSEHYAVNRSDNRDWTPTRRTPGDTRELIDLTTELGLKESRARLWRYPPGARGRRHIEHAQEEVFAVLEGTLTLTVGDPAEELELAAGSVATVFPNTPLQIRNDGYTPLIVLIYGAPPVTGQAEILDE